MKKANKTGKPAAKKKPAATSRKTAKPAAKNVIAARATTSATPAPAPKPYTPGAIQGIGWKPFRYPPE